MLTKITAEVEDNLDQYGSVEAAVDNIFPELNDKYDLWALFSGQERMAILKEAALATNDIGKTIEETKQQGVKVLPEAAITKMKDFLCQKINDSRA